jgi:hypothetical protein
VFVCVSVFMELLKHFFNDLIIAIMNLKNTDYCSLQPAHLMGPALDFNNSVMQRSEVPVLCVS